MSQSLTLEWSGAAIKYETNELASNKIRINARILNKYDEMEFIANWLIREACTKLPSLK